MKQETRVIMTERQRIEAHRDFMVDQRRKSAERLRLIEQLNSAQKARFGSVLYPVEEKELL